MKVLHLIGQMARDQRGLETVEWGILAALIVTGLVAVVATLAGKPDIDQVPEFAKRYKLMKAVVVWRSCGQPPGVAR